MGEMSSGEDVSLFVEKRTILTVVRTESHRIV